MNSLKRHIFLIIAVIICLLPLTLTQQIKPLKMGEVIKGRLELDESHEYFEMQIESVEPDTVLIFETKANKEIEVKSDEMFSDPDFYISKINKYPSSKQSAEWYSERYGSDVLTIPSESLKAGDILYVGMYCQFKCRYFFKAFFSHESTMKLNEYSYVNIKAQETINYKFYVDEEFEEMNLVAYSQNGGKFRIFMNKRGPSSQNTFKVIPSWQNGYTIQVKKSNAHQYCTKCYYHILIQNEGSEDLNKLLIYAQLYGKEMDLPGLIPHFDAMDSNSKRCYAFNMTSDQKANDKLIIQTSMYSGKVTLLIRGWNPADENTKPNVADKDYNHDIISEHFVILDKKDFDKFDSQALPNQSKERLHFCLFSEKSTSSYMLNAYFMREFGKMQASQPYSILVPGNKVRNYLLKDQVMYYQLTGHNLEKVQYDVKTNITFSTFDIVGSTKSYIYFCQKDDCTIAKTEIEDLAKEKLIKPLEKDDFETYKLEILNNENECYKKPNVTLKNGNVINCQTYAIIYCESPNQDGLCIFDVQHTVEDDPLMMQPKKTYYGSIPIGKYDFYNIIITDTNVNSLVVVLNSESGDAELMCFKKSETGHLNSKEGKLVSYSSHNDYIPDVVRLTPQRIGQEDLVGDYLIKVTASSFASYYIYYYVTYNKDPNEAEEKFPEVTLELEIGQVITDYFQYDIRYKIYSFSPITESKSNIRIFIDRVNVDFDIYVYYDFSTFKILPFYEVQNAKKNNKEIISGYDWKDDGDNELTILANDPKFDPDHTYYIVLVPNVPEINEPERLHSPPNEGKEEIIQSKAAIKFYLGLTEGSEEITITEGVPHSMTLDDEYSEQVYYYEHTNIEKDFELEINVYSGEIDVYVDIKEITLDSVKDLQGDEDININGTMYYKLGILDEYDSIIIPSEYFKKNIDPEDKDLGISLYFLIKRSKSAVEDNIECKYSIVQFSSEEHGEILQPGLVKSSELGPGERAFYIIEEVKKRKGGSSITVTFEGGIGNVFVRIPETPEEEKEMRFPSMDNYDYMGESIFTSKVVTIPEEVYNRITVENFKIQILVTVEVYDSNEEPDPDHPGETIDSDVFYTIQYSNEPKNINQNVPYDGFIKKGEFQYFEFYFDESAENIYIGLSNMNGDADMYLNYGKTLPTPDNCDWKANQVNHEYIDFNIKDKFFVSNNIKELTGYYTLLVTGFIDSSYTLFISTHKEQVFPLRNNRPVTCVCEEAGEKCYMRYNEVFDPENKRKGILHNEIIFTSRYSYGSGMMYTKVLKDFELHGKDFYKFFPSETDYEMSNKESNQKNFMKVPIQGNQYSEDASVLMTFICQERTKVEITPTYLRHFNTIEYIGENKENIFYLSYDEVSGTKPEMNIHFYNFETEQDLVYSIHSFTGEAHFQVYANDSRWDIDKQQIVYDYYLFKEFDVYAMDYKDREMDKYNPYSEDYHDYIAVEEQQKHESIIFKVNPRSEFGFFIRVNYDTNWNNIPIALSKSYYCRHHEFMGFFEITNEYSDVDIDLSVEENVLLTADMYVKINVIDVKKKKDIKNATDISEFSLYDYSFPNEKNYDYFASTDPIMGSLHVNIKNLPKLTEEEQQTKFARALIYVKLYPSDFQPVLNFEDEEEIGRIKRTFRHWVREKGEQAEDTIDILITPGSNYSKSVEANPYEYYFHDLTYEKGAKKIPEKKTYTLKRMDPSHDVLIIEISACRGRYNIEITDKLVQNNSDSNKIHYFDRSVHGKHIYYVNNLRSDFYYLTITPKESDFLCKLKDIEKIRNESNPCANDLTYLMHYYSQHKKSLHFTVSEVVNYMIRSQPYGLGKVRVTLPSVISRSLNNNVTDFKDYKFDVFISTNPDDYERMGSVCYLCKYNSSLTINVMRVKNVRIKGNKYLIVGGLGYRRRYYMSILVQNINTKELLTFHPNIVWTGGFLPFHLWQYGVANLLLIALIVILVIVCKKYCAAKQELKEIKGDTLPKMESEVSGSTNAGANSSNTSNTEKVRYSGLGESY